MKKQILALMFGIALLFNACDSSKSKNEISNHILKVGIEPTYKPFDYKENSKLTGFDVDLLEAIAKDLNISLNWVEMNFDGLIPALKTGKIDMIASAMSVTEERKKNADFSNTYYMTKNLYIKRKDDASLTTKDDLANKKIGVQLGTLQENAAKNIKNAIVEANADLNVAILALKNKKIDAIILDKDVAKGYLEQNTDLSSFFEEDDGSSGFSFAFDKDKQKELIEKINQTLEKLKQNGIYENLLIKYQLK
ncbi:transporter substrate-binding domain-containing protein [Campylobacter sp. 2018MI35]|uniref:transporter substrate-binding domain-containing protein n=2 Tax=unclassified Campylobacter TaxID=2593542 RepID=UPI00190772B8|nr:transporter substrate-binding domain-containing protein [Campylobacter sp. 2018MI34]MBK1992189.1 transporter substrate-binding domain-containing protein [Campylobacter sp. 2018MI34]